MDPTPRGGATPSPEQPRKVEDWEVRMRMVERMLEAFKFERFAYLTLSFVACLVLLGASIWLFRSKQTSAAIAIFGSSGVLTFTLARMLRLWNQAWKLVTGA